MNVGIAALHSTVGVGGGTAVYTRSLVEALAEHAPGHRYTVLVASSAASNWNYRQWPGCIRFVALNEVEPRQPIPVRAWRRFRRTVGLPVPPHYGEAYLARQVDGLGLDLLHFPCTVIDPLSASTPAVLSFFDLQQEYYPQFFTEEILESRARTYSASVEKARHVIVPSEFTRDTLIERYGTPEGKVSVLPVGLADSFRRAPPAEIGRVRAKYGLPEQFVFYPANPWPHKNHARLMAALRIYRERHGQAPWLVLSGRLHIEHRDATLLALAAGVSDRVVDLGFLPQEDITALYSAASLMVFPSLFEGFGMPLVEAMACGCPVAAADATTVPEVTGGAALLFDPLDPEAIADALHIGLSDPDLRTDLVERGYRQLPRFGWSAIVAMLIRIYEQVMKPNPSHETAKGRGAPSGSTAARC